jgi:hypothetical protein
VLSTLATDTQQGITAFENDLSLFTDNLSNGDLLDALGLPLAANTGMDTLFAGFAFAVIDHAATRSLVTSRVRSRNGKRNAP